MYKFNLENIKVNTSNGVEEMKPKQINVIVGPNNSGKSRFLKEIRDFLTGDNKDLKIIKEIKYPFPKDFLEFDEAYDITSKMLQDSYGNWILNSYTNKPNQVLNLSDSLENYFSRSRSTFCGDWKDFIARTIHEKEEMNFLNWCGPLFFQYLGTEERLTICKAQKNYGLNTSMNNYLSSFKFHEELLEKLALKTRKIFKKDIYLDDRTLGEKIALRVGENFEKFRKVKIEEEEAKELLRENLLDEEGDGLKSFVSTFLSLNFNKKDILLLDEPEAFLHPPLARQVGEMIGECGEKENIIFVATHNVEILKGILSKNQNVNVIRITRSNKNENEFKLLDTTLLQEVLLDPLLRTSRVLEGIFCEKVVITEAEADEIFFQETIEKIFPESGLFFVHGQNKQTLVNIANLYKEIGVKYEIITDFDVLRVPKEFSAFLEIMEFEEKYKQKLISYTNKLREIINNSVENNNLGQKELKEIQKKKRDEVYHKKGIQFFEEEMQLKIQKTIKELSNQHLHIISTGELETMLTSFAVSYKEKKDWIVEAIKKVDELTKEDFIKEENIYSFVKKIIDE